MWPFKKKKKDNVFAATPQQLITKQPKECQHKWRDFEPILYSSYNFYYKDYKQSKYGRLHIRLVEPYVCCLCLKREDRELCSWEFENLTREEAYAKLQDFKQENAAYIAPRAKVEDEIADMQHNIDREFLRNLALYHPEKVGSSFKSIVKVPTLSDFKEDKNNE